MNWILALLAALALGQAGLPACAGGHGHGASAGHDPAAMGMMAAHGDDHAHHGGHHGAHHGTPHPGPAVDMSALHGGGDHDAACPDCAAGRACSQCAVLTVTRTASFELSPMSGQPRFAVPFGDATPHRPANFDPPPPKAVSLI